MQVDVHSGGDIDGVSVQGHRDRRRVGPDAWDEGWLVTSASFPAVSSSFESEILLSLSCHGYLQPGPDSIGIIAVSHNCSGVAARACGLVSLEPTKVCSVDYHWSCLVDMRHLLMNFHLGCGDP